MHYSIISMPICIVVVVFAAFSGIVQSTIKRTVNETEMFYYEIRPELFNWTNGVDDKFVYTPSLQNYPDLPPWIHYKFNNKNRYGYLYGTPPVILSEQQVLLDIIGLNKKTYQTARQELQLNIVKKYDIAKKEIRFKIHNLNVEDMFQEEHIPHLLDIFRQNLWTDSKHDLHVTFLASSSDLGQRLPLDPNDTEGVVVNLGSWSNFSTVLYDLKKEIGPLQKMNKCPKDFKRTSVERYFRFNGFNLDWCSFKLVELINLNQNQTIKFEDDTSSTKYIEKNTWPLMESLKYTQIKSTDSINTFNTILLIFIICVLGVVLSITIFKWYTKKKLIFT